MLSRTFLLLFVLAFLAFIASAEHFALVEDEDVSSLLKPKVKACWKDAVGRGTGERADPKTGHCPVGKPEKSGNQCFAKCPANYEGKGPVCWESCASSKYTSNGVVFCCQTDEICAKLLTTLGKTLPQALIKFAMDIAMQPENVLKILIDFRKLVEATMELGLEKCSKLKFEDVIVMSEATVEEIEEIAALFNQKDQIVLNEITAAAYAEEGVKKNLRESSEVMLN